jgi:hypothetical protein
VLYVHIKREGVERFIPSFLLKVDIFYLIFPIILLISTVKIEAIRWLSRRIAVSAGKSLKQKLRCLMHSFTVQNPSVVFPEAMLVISQKDVGLFEIGYTLFVCSLYPFSG